MVLPLAKLEVNRDQTEGGSGCGHVEGDRAVPDRAPCADHGLLTCGSSTQSRSGFVWAAPTPLVPSGVLSHWWVSENTRVGNE